MSKEVLQAIKAICDEKHIPVESVLTTIEQALAAAYRKDFGNKMQNLRVQFDPETMNIRVFDVKTVVEDQDLEELAKQEEEKKEEVQTQTVDASALDELEEKKRFNPKTEIMISEARVIKPKAKIGEEIVTELPTPGEFGRMAAQTAKQVIIQRLREAERDVIFKAYKDKEGEIVNGTIQRIEGGAVLVDIGQATAVLPPREQVRGDRYTPGTPMRFFIKSVASASRGPEVLISRASPELVKKLFALEVPEIESGAVEIKSVAREPGSRTKIAVVAHEKNVDAVGSCVGQRGTPVQFIINELGGEKIDIIEWDEDMVKFIKNSLSPAKIAAVKLNGNETARAFVGEGQFSLAIGKQGQNVRLASELAGVRIDIRPEKVESVAKEKDGEEAEVAADSAGAETEGNVEEKNEENAVEEKLSNGDSAAKEEQEEKTGEGLL